MHAMVNYLLFMVLAILPLLQIIHDNNNNNNNNFIMVNARKLTTQKKIFSVELILRNFSTKTPSLGSISRNHKIKHSSRLYDSKTVQSVIIPDGGDYDMKISIGTPPVEFTAVVDTGSDLIWVRCTSCQSCLQQPPPFFVPTQSSTNKIIPCTSRICNATQLGLTDASCFPGDNSCNYQAYYGAASFESGTSGLLSAETVTFPSTSISNVLFGCAYDQTGHLPTHSNGIVGLGGGPLSLVSQLGHKINFKFSYCLTPRGSRVNSKLNFGLDVTGPGPVTSIPFAQQDTPPTFYYVTLNSISIGSTSIPITNSITNFIAVDSGTTLTYLASDVYDKVRTAVMKNIRLTTVNSPSPDFDLCYKTDSLDGLNFPGLVFRFSGGDVLLKAENSFLIIEKGVVCFAMGGTDEPPFIFGNYAQTNFHVGFDLQAKQVSFAVADCTNF